MYDMRKKSNSNFVPKQPRQGWAFFEETGQWRRTPEPWGAPKNHFPRELGDWVAINKPKGWQPPAGTLAGESLLGAGGASLNAAEGGSGGGMKIGAGHKPQPYGWHGYYGGTGGGSSPGPVYQGKVTLPHEVRGPVTKDVRAPVPPPSKVPAVVTWKNDENDKPDPKMEDLRQPMQKTVEDMKTQVPQLESVNVNSGDRDKGEPHASGRAVDINNISGVRVVDLSTATGPKAEQAREAAANLEEWAKGKDEVTQIIGPTGWWERNSEEKMEPKIATSDREIKILGEHKNHYHITTRW
jgi:hypothetical protein